MELNYVFCEWVLYNGTRPRAKDRKRTKVAEIQYFSHF